MSEPSKRRRPGAVLGDTTTIPEKLRRCLECLSTSYPSSVERNLTNLTTSLSNPEMRLYGLVTAYAGNLHCWVQPTRTKDTLAPTDYGAYVTEINRMAQAGQLQPLPHIAVGVDCIAQYESDSNWYRAKILGPPDNSDGKWLVLFVDYGNVQYCLSEQMAQIVQSELVSHFHSPLQAVVCHLYNIVPLSQSAMPEIESRLETYCTRLKNKFVELVVKQVRPDSIVECDIFLTKHELRPTESPLRRLLKHHIGQRLVDADLATFADPIAAFTVSPKSVKNVPVIKVDHCGDRPDSSPDSPSKRPFGGSSGGGETSFGGDTPMVE